MLLCFANQGRCEIVGPPAQHSQQLMSGETIDVAQCVLYLCLFICFSLEDIRMDLHLPMLPLQ